ncbi:MAG: hypothetical protein FWE36_07850 [Erysipelotrichales bacterium]|nr:hypothetical protein [Erysipelotrichales bacterium]
MPDFRDSLTALIEKDLITISQRTFQFERIGNYYRGVDEILGAVIYFSFDGDILNVLLRNFGVFNRMNLQFERVNI